MAEDQNKAGEQTAPAGAVTSSAVGQKPDNKPKTIKRPPADKMLSGRSGGPYATKG